MTSSIPQTTYIPFPSLPPSQNKQTLTPLANPRQPPAGHPHPSLLLRHNPQHLGRNHLVGPHLRRPTRLRSSIQTSSSTPSTPDVAHLTTTFSEAVEAGNFANWAHHHLAAHGQTRSRRPACCTPRPCPATTRAATRRPKRLAPVYRINGVVVRRLHADGRLGRTEGEPQVQRLPAVLLVPQCQPACRRSVGTQPAQPRPVERGETRRCPVPSTGPRADLVEGAADVARWWAVFPGDAPASTPRKRVGRQPAGGARRSCVRSSGTRMAGPCSAGARRWCGRRLPGVLYELERPRVCGGMGLTRGVGGFADKGYYFLRTPYTRRLSILRVGRGGCGCMGICTPSASARRPRRCCGSRSISTRRSALS